MRGRGHLLRAGREVVGGAGDVGGRRVELGDERAKPDVILRKYGELAELVVGLEGELVPQLAA